MNLHPKSDAPIRLQFMYEFHYNHVNNMDAIRMLSKVLVVVVMEEVASKMGYSKLTSTAKRSSVVLFGRQWHFC